MEELSVFFLRVFHSHFPEWSAKAFIQSPELTKASSESS